MRTQQEKQRIMDSLVGKPFMLLPGSPADHVVCGESLDQERKYRVHGVQMVWNDMLLQNAIEGPGHYQRMASQVNMEFLEVAERLYGVSAVDGLSIWLQLPNLSRPMEWPSTENLA